MQIIRKFSFFAVSLGILVLVVSTARSTPRGDEDEVREVQLNGCDPSVDPEVVRHQAQKAAEAYYAAPDPSVNGGVVEFTIDVGPTADAIMIDRDGEYLNDPTKRIDLPQGRTMDVAFVHDGANVDATVTWTAANGTQETRTWDDLNPHSDHYDPFGPLGEATLTSIDHPSGDPEKGAARFSIVSRNITAGFVLLDK